MSGLSNIAHFKTSAAGILGLQAGEDVNGREVRRAELPPLADGSPDTGALLQRRAPRPH
jgi:hypothetical protein